MHDSPTPPSAPPGRRRGFVVWLKEHHDWLWIAGIVLAIALLLIFGRRIVPHLADFVRFMTDQGVLGLLAVVVVYVVCVLLFLPSAFITILAGVIYGGARGTLLMVFSSTLAATVAFLVSRYLVRERVERWMRRHPRVGAVDKAVAEKGWKMVLLLRLSPVLPFPLLNYALGVTRIGFWVHLVWTFIGMIPSTALFVYAGALASETAWDGRPSLLRMIVGLAIIVTTIILTVYTTMIARRAIREEEAQRR